MKTENLTKEHAELIRLVNDGLAEIHTKKMEYLLCSADGNPNQEYFKGKADAYEYAYKTFKRILEWTASGSVATTKEEAKENSTIAYARAMAGTLREYSRSVQGVLVRQDLAHTADLLSSMSVQLKVLKSQLKEREESLKELILIAERTAITVVNPDWKELWKQKREILIRAKSLLK